MTVVTVVTVAERKAREVARLKAAVLEMSSEMAGYGARSGVRFVIFGSFARGDAVASSDLDIMIDGPAEHLQEARRFVEDSCERVNLRHDVHLAREASEKLMTRVRRDGIALS